MLDSEDDVVNNTICESAQARMDCYAEFEYFEKCQQAIRVIAPWIAQ